MMPYLFNIISVLLIIFIVWWFWLSKSKIKKVDADLIKITVKDGVYQPARIEVVANKPITLEIIREDGSPCSEFLIFDTLEVHEKLPLRKPHIINLGKLPSGTYSFGCQMKMYVGELIVN